MFEHIADFYLARCQYHLDARINARWANDWQSRAHHDWWYNYYLNKHEFYAAFSAAMR